MTRSSPSRPDPGPIGREHSRPQRPSTHRSWKRDCREHGIDPTRKEEAPRRLIWPNLCQAGDDELIAPPPASVRSLAKYGHLVLFSSRRHCRKVASGLEIFESVRAHAPVAGRKIFIIMQISIRQTVSSSYTIVKIFRRMFSIIHFSQQGRKEVNDAVVMRSGGRTQSPFEFPALTFKPVCHTLKSWVEAGFLGLP